MARDEELNFRVTADTARAVDNVDELADKVGDLEDQPHETKVTADTAAAEQAARQLDARLAGLPREQQIAILAKLEERSKRDLDQLNRDLANAARFSDQELELKLRARDEASAKLNAVQAEIREIDGATPTVEVQADTTNAKQAVNDLENQLGQLGGRVGDLGGGLSRAVNSPAGAIGALVGGLLLAANYTADRAIAADEIAKLSGDEVEMASRIASVWRSAGFEVKDLQDVLLQMGGVLESNQELTKKLGIDMNDGRTLGERFVQVVELLGDKYRDAGERSVVASQLFGEEGVRQVNSVIAAVGDLGEAIENVPQANIVTDADVERARDVKAEIARIKADGETIANTLGRGGLFGLGAAVKVIADGGSALAFAGEKLGQVLSPWNTGARQANAELVAAYEASTRAVEEFDRSQLDGLTTIEQVRARVVELTGDLGAANLVAVEWARANGIATSELERQNQVRGTYLAQQDSYVSGLERAGQAQRDLADDTDEASSAIDDQRVSWQDFSRALSDPLALLDQIRGVMEGVRETARSGIFAGIRDELADDQLALDYADALDRIRQAEIDLADAKNKSGDESIEATRAQRDLDRAVLGYKDTVTRLLESLDNLPLSKITEIQVAMRTGDLEEVDRLLDDATADRFVKITTFREQLQAAFNSINVGINPGGTPSGPTYNSPSGPTYVDQRTTNNYFPPGVVPTEVVAAETIDGRRGGRQ